MTGALATMLINGVIIVLLVLTIGYCWMLNRRIKVLQDSKSELAMLLKHFDDSTQRASESIIGLQTASKRIGENIQHRIDKANYLLDDLAFMIEKGNKLANQMEAGFAVGRAQQRVSAEQPRYAAQTAAVRPAAQPVFVPPVQEVARQPVAVEAVAPKVDEAVVEVVDVEQKTASSQDATKFQRYELPVEPKATATAPSRDEALREVARDMVRNPNTLEEALTRVMSRNREMQAQEDTAKGRERGRVRTRSEQELLDLIKSGIKG